MGTHELWHSSAEAASDAFDFMHEIRKKVSETHCEKNRLSLCIKPLSSSPLTPHKLWEMSGAKTVTIRISTQDTRWATFVVIT